MRKLHVVGFTTDHDGLIFSTRKGSKSGSFVVAISDELFDKLAEAERLRNGGEAPAAVPAATGERSTRREDRDPRRTRPESNLTPREIQARLRAGRSIDEVAKEARVDYEWVERFAAPIIAEQAQVVELARSLTFTKARRGESPLPLGDSVALNLVDRGLRMLEDEFDRAWSAHQVHDGVWTVQFRYRSRGRDQQATWELDMASRRLVARDRLGSDLGYVDRTRRRRAAARPEIPDESESDIDPATPPAMRASPARKRPAAAKAKAKAKPKSTAAKTAAKRRPPARPTKAAPTAPAKAPAKKTARAAPAARTARKRTATATAKKTSATGAKKRTKSVAAASAEASTASRVPRPLAPRPPGPRFGTDGSAVVTARTSRRPTLTPAPVPPRSMATARPKRPTPVPPPAPSAARSAASSAARSPMPPRAPASGPLGVSGRSDRRPEGGPNGLVTPGRSVPPRQVPRRVEPAPRSTRPVISPAPPPASRRPPERRAPIPMPSPMPTLSEPEIDLDDALDDDLADDLGLEPARGEAPPPPPPPPRRAATDENDDEDAFVIRPRISAKQASELAYSDTPAGPFSPSFS
ncbi:MAG: septation protein SepH [Acidimicrobiales bacterium]